jgi:hypothetical protein
MVFPVAHMCRTLAILRSNKRNNYIVETQHIASLLLIKHSKYTKNVSNINKRNTFAID